jgi:hypothetical protein
MSAELDPRIAQMFRGSPMRDRFLAHALCAILQTKEGLLDQVIAAFQDVDVDWGQRLFPNKIGGTHTLLDFNGKNADLMRAEKHSEAEIELVRSAYVKRGMVFPEHGAGYVEPEQPTKVKRPTVEVHATKTDDAPAPVTEPAFAGHPLSDLLGKTDQELLSIEGISRATIKEIRKAERARGTE